MSSTNLASLKSKRRNKEAEKRQYQTQQANINENIQRLENTKRYVWDLKSRLEDVPTKIKKIPEDYKSDWAGNTYTQIKNISQDSLYNEYANFVQKIDVILDNLCDEITRLENKSREIGGIIGSIWNSINNLSNKIEKFNN